jgi:hypothetical protein
MTGWTWGEPIELDGEPGWVLTASRDRALVELADGRALDVDTRALDPAGELPDPDVEDGSHEWPRGMGTAP